MTHIFLMTIESLNDHGVFEWFDLEKIRIISFQLCHGQGCFPLSQVAPNPVLGHFQGGWMSVSTGRRYSVPRSFLQKLGYAQQKEMAVSRTKLTEPEPHHCPE